MKTLRFTNEDPAFRQFAGILRKRVHQYFVDNKITTKGDARMYFKSVVLFTLYIAPIVLVLTLPVSLLTAALLMVVMGIGMAGVGMSVMHDAVHGAYSNKKWVNTLMGSSIYLIGSSTATWSIQHNFLHHTFTNVTGFDEDIDTKGFVRLSKNASWFPYQRYQHIYAFFFYGLMTLAKLVGDFPQLLKYNREGLTHHHNEKPAREIIRMIITKTVYLAVMIGLPLWITDFTWWQVIIGFLIVHMTGGIIMSVIFQLAHVVEGTEQPMPDKASTIHKDWMVHELQTTADFAPRNFFLNWYVGGLNFQIEHHLFSNICHIHYQKIAPIVAATAREFGIVYNVKPTFMDALLSHVRLLKEFGRNDIVLESPGKAGGGGAKAA